MSVTLPKVSMTLCMALKIQIPFRFANYVWMAQQHTASDRVVKLMVKVQVVFGRADASYNLCILAIRIILQVSDKIAGRTEMLTAS